MKPPLGMLVHTHKVMPILSSVLVLIGFSDLACRDQPRGHPHSVGNPYTNSPPSSIVTLLYVYGQASQGVASSIRDTPQDDLSIRKSNAYSLQRIKDRLSNSIIAALVVVGRESICHLCIVGWVHLISDRAIKIKSAAHHPPATVLVYLCSLRE